MEGTFFWKRRFSRFSGITMSPRIIVLYLIVFSLKVSGQQLEVAHISGSLTGGQNANFGELNQEYKAHPDAMIHGSMWNDGRQLWLFGGQVQDEQNGIYKFSNRLWSFNSEEGWILRAGDTNELRLGPSDTTLLQTNYGQKGLVAASNYPGARSLAAYGLSPSGEMYMYGGFGEAVDGVGVLADLWKFDGQNWVWLAGSKYKDTLAYRGSLNQSGPSFHPGARKGANIWFDDQGNLFLFAGSRASYGASNLNYNDIWKWDGSTWTWIDGSNLVDQGPTGSPGQFSYPAACQQAALCKSVDGSVYLYGGLRSHPSFTSRSDNTLWKYQNGQWTLLDGDPLNGMYFFSNPQPRFSHSLFELNGKLYLLGGALMFYWNRSYFQNYAIWDNGSWSNHNLGSQHTSNPVYHPNNYFYNRFGSAAAANSHEVFLYGGSSADGVYHNSLFKFNGQMAAMLSSNVSHKHYQWRHYARNQPGGRSRAAHAPKGEHEVYMFGGESADGLRADLWFMKNGQWTWIGGDSAIDALPVYGNLGISDPANHPGARHSAQMWFHGNDSLWLFGGFGYDANGQAGPLNDLWLFDGQNWTWMKGSKWINDLGSFATQGQSAATNNPPARYEAALYRASAHEVWLFGGRSQGAHNLRNDHWRFNGQDWIWEGGSSGLNNGGNYGLKGQSSPSNIPAAAAGFAVADANQGYYLYGGEGINAQGAPALFSHLWFFDTQLQEWTWLGGSCSGTAVFGKATANRASLSPGHLYGAAAWWSEQGLFLFGGYRDSLKLEVSNNLWHWDGQNWAWLKGAQNQSGHALAARQSGLNHFSLSSLPSARSLAASWESDGYFYLFGGQGFEAGGQTNAHLADTWEFQVGNFWNGSSWSQFSPSNSVMGAQILDNLSPGVAIICGDLCVDADYQLDLAFKELRVSGDIHPYGALLNQAKISLVGDSLQSIIGAELKIDSLLILPEGASLNTNDSLHITSNSAQKYGQFYNLGTVNGEIQFDYFLDIPNSPNSGRYFHFGPVLNQVSIADLASGGYFGSGSADPSLNTLWLWEPLQAQWVSPTVNHHLVSDWGYAIYAGKNSHGDFLLENGQAGSLKLRGSALNNAEETILLYYNDGQASNVSFAGGQSQAATEGWNFISNPYMHNIDLTEALKSLSNQAVYVWDGHQYRAYVNGVSINGGSPILAPGQGAMVQVASDQSQALPNLSLDARRDWLESSISKRLKNQMEKDGLQISLRTDSNHLDELYIGFESGASPNFDGAYDAWKFPEAGKEQLAALGPDGSYAIYQNQIVAYQELRLKTSNPETNKSYSLQFNTLNLRAYQKVILQDLKQDKFVELKANSQYVYVGDSLWEDRFVLHFGQPLGESEAESPKCLYSFLNGKEVYVQIDDKRFKGACEIELYNSAGQLVEVQKIKTHDHPGQVLTQAKTGIYLLKAYSLPGKHLVQSLKIYKP